jgi:predicted Rossmann fold nucleotide-binding protein DprA/Smf involved in DNA uptake
LEVQAILQLTAVPGFGTVRLNRLFDYLNQTETLLRYLVEYGQADLVAEAGFTPVQADAFVTARELAELQVETIDLDQIQLITKQSAFWPERFSASTSPKLTPWVFVHGDIGTLRSESIGLGGSRSATDLAVLTARSATALFVEHRKTIVSGGAKGIDSVAHTTAVDHGGHTIIVLAQGLQTRSAPIEWGEAVVAGSATAISEYPPGTPWSPFRAMQRNRTILTLSDAFFIPQAGTKGGTYEAGLASIKMNKPTFVARFIGDLGASYEGNEALIGKGASPVEIDGASGNMNDEGLARILEHDVDINEQLPLF